MELICGGREAEIEDQIQELGHIRDMLVIQKGIIGQYLPMIRRIAERALNRAGEEQSAIIEESYVSQASILERSAILALCKIMAFSKEICGENIKLMFNLIEAKNIDSIIKCNIVLAIGDLYQRHANVLDDYIKRIFNLLHSKDDNIVRK